MLPAAEFELFDNVADLLKAMGVTLLFALIVRDHLQHTHTHFYIHAVYIQCSTCLLVTTTISTSMHVNEP